MTNENENVNGELPPREQENVIADWLRRQWWKANGNAEVLRRLDSIDLKLEVLWDSIRNGGLPPEPPEPGDNSSWFVDAWAIAKYTNPQFSDLSRGLAWAKYVGPHDKVAREYQGRQKKMNGQYGPPIFNAAKVGTVGRFRFGDPSLNEPTKKFVDTFLCYRKPIQGDSDVFIEVCDPLGFYIEWKWLEFPLEDILDEIPF